MKEVGDRGYQLTADEASRVITHPEFDRLDQNGGIIVDLNVTILENPRAPKVERLFVLAGSREKQMFEGVCEKVVPPVRVSSTSARPNSSMR